MCARLLACPLCSQPGFNTLDSLRAGLVSVATRALACPVCNEILMGIDKLTIHLFGHTIYGGANNHNNNNNHQNNRNGDDHRGTNGNCVEPKIVELQQATRGPSGNTIWIEGNAATAAANVCSDSGGKLLNGNDGASIFIPIEEIENFRSDNNKQVQQRQAVVLQNIGGGVNLLPVSSMSGADFANDKIGKEYYAQTDWSKNSNEQQQQQQRLESRTDMLAELVKNAQITASPFPVNNYEPTTSDGNNIDDEDDDDDDDNDRAVVEAATASAKPIVTSQRLLTKDERPERCDICGFGFPDLKILLLHKQIAHRVPEAQARLGPEQLHMKNFPCHLCSKVFTIKGSLMVHMKVAHPGVNRPVNPDRHEMKESEGCIYKKTDKGFECPNCGKVFTKEQNIIQHIQTHDSKQWECDVCCKLFTTKYFLKKHKRLHSGEMPYKCGLCDKTFTFQQSYHKHKLYHKDEKPHECKTCGRAFKELSTLHNHERIHTGEKPFECESCGKCFRQRVSYLVHRRIHTGVMPYECTICGKKFRYKVSQRTHKCVPSSNSTATASGSSNADSSVQAAATATFQSEGDNATVYPDVNPNNNNNNNNSNSSSSSNFLLFASGGKEQALKRKLEAEIENEDGSSTLHQQQQQQNNRSMMLLDGGGGSSSRSNDDFANLCWATTTTTTTKSRDEPKDNEITILAVINDKRQTTTTTTVWPGKKMPDSPSTDDSLMKELDKVSEDYRSGVWSSLTQAAASQPVQSSPSSEMMRSLSLAEVTTGIANDNKSSQDCCDDYFAPLADHPNAVAVVELQQQQQQQQRDNDDTSMTTTTTTTVEVSMMNDDNETARGVGGSGSSLSTLQTINEDSLKELLNSIADK
ncbi:hypothetical protein TKK_0003988 [Trichogramma kaykai]